VVSFTPRPLYLQGKSYWYPLDRRLGRSKNPKGRDHFEDLGVDGRIRSKRTLKKLGGRVWTGFIWLRIGTSGGLL
jgi:hypothetical protein